VGAVSIEGFQPLVQYYRSIENLLGEMTSGPTRPNTETILIPGEGSARRLQQSCSEGLQIPDELWSDVVEVARDLGVQHPLLESKAQDA
jgi:LDH2 family malate/lactate/ureidoglycolate dehydrogenase